jgi:hypothetical protein
MRLNPSVKWSRTVLLLLGVACGWDHVNLTAAPPVMLAGRWKLNRELSEFPAEVGFGFASSGDDSTSGGRQSSGGGGGGRRRGGGGSGGGRGGPGSFDSKSVRVSEEDADKIKELIAEAKTPSPVLAISQTETSVTITDSQDRARVFHPTGKEEIEQLDAGPIGSTSKLNGQQLVIQFTITDSRIFRYVYSRLPSGQLLVETQLEEGRTRDKADVIKRVYDLDPSP